MSRPDASEQVLARQVLQAYRQRRPLMICGGGSKLFYGRCSPPDLERLDTTIHCGVVDYAPDELVITVKAGTPLLELQQTLARQGQMLGFEPPLFGPSATIGGAVASGLAGCGRAYRGGVRDFILGVKILSGRGDIMRFGGQVMKNVAGFDLSRLMAGAMGTLGVLLEVSLRVLPLPESELTLLVPHADANSATRWMNWVARRALPVSATAWFDGATRVRLSGTTASVHSTMQQLNGQPDDDGEAFWQHVNNHTLGLFQTPVPLIRVLLATDSPVLLHRSPLLVDWGGAQRWLTDQSDMAAIKTEIESAGGEWSRFRGGDRSGEVFPVPAPAVMRLQKNLKAAFDPVGILNPGRMYREL